MAENRVQFQKGMSQAEFMQRFSSERQCAAPGQPYRRAAAATQPAERGVYLRELAVVRMGEPEVAGACAFLPLAVKVRCV